MKRSFLFLLALLFGICGHAQLVTGVTDRAIYTDSATFTAPTAANFSYEVTLNGAPILAGVSHTIRRMDFYELLARRTDLTSAAVSTQYVRFIVVSSRRGSPETGMIEWTPFPPIPSAREELSGAHLTIVAPQNYPTNLHIPVIAWVDNGPGNARRVNGNLTSAMFPTNTLPLRRGVGHTFLPPQPSPATIDYNPKIHDSTATRQIQIEPATTWQTVTGILPANTTWPANSRVHVTGNLTISAGNTLTVGEGTVVRLNAGVNITNSGRTIINGALENPVTFTAAAPVAPERHQGAWGGFLLRGASAEFVANGAIFTGSGANANFDFSPGDAHRDEQALLLVHSGAKAFLTNCFLINNAGQIANGYNAEVTFDHCLLQRAITAGEFVGTTLTINNSAVIEFPSIDGEVNAAIADSDYDGLYFTTGNYLVKDSLIGFCKDDAIDAGGNGGGPVTITNCWFESTLHEGLAWSGTDRPGHIYDTVFINCGQGIECGYSVGPGYPFAYNERVLCVGNGIGARFGDNYTGTTGLGVKQGFMTVTNSILIHNYRDVFGRCWDDTWNYRAAQMDVRGNYLSAPNPFHPANSIWNPETDGALLAPYLNSPPDAVVGIGFANWAPLTFVTATNSVPIRLSSFAIRNVAVSYAIETQTATLGAGTLQFDPGETVKQIPWPANVPTNQPLRIVLRNPIGADVTTTSSQLILPTPSDPTRLNFLIFGGETLLHWSNPTFRLEATSNIADPQSWTPVTDSSPFTLPNTDNMKFYRLAQ